MSQDLKQELTDMLAPADWAWISPHANRGAVVVVDPQLDLVEVGMAIATDNTAAVNHWIAEALITKPSPLQLEVWDQAAKKQFQSLIVQPFVLVQEAPVHEN
ncbi:DUF2288 family protein [Phormidium tenue FACHB-1052]|uniref:DUF2288 domain-containing protein n=2 Tax=Phormidium tenue TaxID=126344 RepID=A0A1U7JA93_9CYAN|nr:DUF2288 domain-containing protein [Phormidium tenue]MBD2230586.1 DUF2288 family protein [Phormidium tenue FACHB-1052]OKH50646.1 hypothetical protein NIES30_00640 [Phormidium tenue NIES-30]